MIDRDIIYLFGAHSWEWITRRPEHIARELARQGNRVMFVETPFDFDLKNIDWRRLWSASNRTIVAKRLNKGGVERIESNLWIYRTPFVLPRRPGIMRTVNMQLLKRAVRRAARAIGFSAPVLVLGDVRGGECIGSFGESLVCYDSVDEETGFTADENDRNEIRRRVEYVVGRADVVLASSRKLYDDKRMLNPHTHFVPNAVDGDMLLSADLSLPPELAGLSRPIFGFTGYIEEWLDLDLIKYLARLEPSWNFVFVGPSRIDTGLLRSFPNVHLIGRQSYREMPRWINAFDACIIPFKVNSLTDAVNPLKLYEYLLLGKPVVTTDFHEMRFYDGQVLRAASPAAFAAHLHEITAGQGIDAPAATRRRQWAMQNTWQVRVNDIMRIIDERLSKSGEG